eukprot:12015018-Alexandrium_andersonii.AAC.1
MSGPIGGRLAKALEFRSRQCARRCITADATLSQGQTEPHAVGRLVAGGIEAARRAEGNPTPYSNASPDRPNHKWYSEPLQFEPCETEQAFLIRACCDPDLFSVLPP